MDGGKRRAMSSRQKAQRRQAILDVAWVEFAARPYAAILMAEVAAAAGLAKGTLYLYFPTKEALFLAVLEAQLAAWFDAVDASLDAGAVLTATAVADVLCATLEARPGLARLLALLHGVLEANVDRATALAFKRFLLARVTATGERLERRLALAPGQGVQALLWTHALVIGLGSMTDAPPVIREVQALPELALFDFAFGPALVTTLRLLLRGMEGEALGRKV